MSDLSADLYHHLIVTMYAVHPLERRSGHCEWRMNPEWCAECRQLKDTSGRPLWVANVGPSLAYLLGYPVKVSEEYGVPELVFELA